MTNTIRSLAAAALICAVTAAILFYRASDYFAPSTDPIVAANPSINNKPAGEFTKGFVLEQSLVIDPATVGMISNLAQICIEPELATYARSNSGKLRISLMTSKWSSTGVFDFENSPNNDFASICEVVQHVPSTVQTPTIRIESLEGEPGSSITAWLTEDTSRGAAVINGAQTNMSLIFAITKPSDPAQRITQQNILVLIYMMATAVLAISAFRREKAS